nr:ribonuclease H-like domain, reverse transcriptase, RNA-dependent DNA polymerase [Tanacetum cinerariifolium]
MTKESGDTSKKEQALPEEQLLQITKHKTTKAIWDALKTRHIGEERVQQARLQTLKSDFEMLHIKEDDTIDTFIEKLTILVNKAASLGHTIEDQTLVRKLLNVVPDRTKANEQSNLVKEDLEPTLLMAILEVLEEGKQVKEVEEQNVSLHEEDVGYKETNMDSQCRAPFPKKAKARSTSLLVLVYKDLCRPILPPTPSGKKYIFLLVDDYSGYMWVYFLSMKDQAFDTFKEYKNTIENELMTTLKMLRTDRGGEFTSNEFTQYCKENGIARQLTAHYSPQQNEAEAVRHAIYILNSVPTKALEDITPYEAIKRRKPKLKNLRVFGCIAYAKVPSQRLTKSDDRSSRMVYLGNEQGSKAYRLFDPTKQKICVSRDVKFKENETWDWKEYISEHINDESEWTDFKIENLEVTSEHHDQGTQPIEEENEFPNNDDDGYASPTTDSFSYSQTSHAPSISSSQTKKDANGNIIKHKARLVAKGYIHEHGIDFEEVFAPIARMETIRLLLAIAANNKWEVHHLNVKSAFLPGDLKEEVYVTQPKRFTKREDNGKVYRLIKSRVWNIKLDNTLKSLDFYKCALEQAIYTKISRDSTIIVGVYVDDLIITGTPKKEIEKFKAQMEEKFKMSDLGLLAYYRGIEVTQTSSDISINRFMQEPREHNMKAIRQVLRYVKGTKDYGITYKHNRGDKIHGFNDSSYRVNTQEGKGTTGIIFTMAKGLHPKIIVKEKLEKGSFVVCKMNVEQKAANVCILEVSPVTCRQGMVDEERS